MPDLLVVCVTTSADLGQACHLFMQEQERWNRKPRKPLGPLMHSRKPEDIKISIEFYMFEQQQNNPECLFYHLKNAMSATSADYLHD